MTTKNQKKIIIFSTYSEDTIISATGKNVKKVQGGPLYYLCQALGNLRLDYVDYNSGKAKIEIQMTANDEVGRVVDLPVNIQIPNNIFSDFTIVSTILDEWRLDNISSNLGKIFIDIQGYVRQTGETGKKSMWNDIDLFSKYIFCLKGTEEEMSYIPRKVLEDQKNRLLIITRGKKGVVWFCQGKKYFSPIEREIKSHDTIGLGDTFFGYFVGYLYKGYLIELAMINAIKQTEEFLNLKN
jgi:hypothetical protein